MQAPGFTFDPGWALLLRDIGIDYARVLSRAGLPADTLRPEGVTVPSSTLFALWSALEQEAADPMLPLRLADAMTTESFFTALATALSSENLVTAATRLGEYEDLVGPIRFSIDTDAAGVTISVDADTAGAPCPPGLLLWKLVFITRIARMGTREHVAAEHVTWQAPGCDARYSEYFGAPVMRGPRATVRFRAADASRPFLSNNDVLWRALSGSLKRAAPRPDTEETTRHRVRDALLSLLPSGRASLDDVSKRLNLSRRTLQRRLTAEGAPFQSIVDDVRRELAEEYLRNSPISCAEIAFLIGFADPNSFFRAFRDWTGQTPESVRAGRAG